MPDVRIARPGERRLWHGQGRLALHGDGTHRVSLDQAIETMRQAARDMKRKYKETSTGGLAVNVPLRRAPVRETPAVSKARGGRSVEPRTLAEPSS